MEKEKFFLNSVSPPPPSLSFGASSASPPNMDIQIDEQLPNCFLNLNWENSMEHNVPFESALSSIVSSPVASNSSVQPGESVVIRELIGRLGSICNSGEISPHGGGASYMAAGAGGGGNNSTNTSCYSTPLSSPPKLNLSMMDHHHHQNRGNLPIQGNSIQTHHSTLAPFPSDPGFAERAARFSCFGTRNFGGLNGQFGLSEAELPYRSNPRVENGKLSRVSSSQSLKVNGSQLGGGHDNKDYPLQDMLEADRKFSRFSRSSTPENGEFNNANEDSSVSEQIPSGETGVKGGNDVNGRKRKAVTRGKTKETSAKDAKVEDGDSNAKRSKPGEANGNEKDSAKAKGEQDGNNNTKEAPKVPEPPKDYIHVRARRGQATDSHSLAERVRREKISERMKFLQDLVPGCNKVTGKAVMLDEIINYVQSLQRQVEFLSMKLSTVNPRLDFNMEALLSKDILQSRGSFPHSMYPIDSSASAFPYSHQPQQGLGPQSGLSNGTENALDAVLRRSLGMQLPPLDGFCESASQLATFWEDDLQSVVQMGFGQNQTREVAFPPQNSHGLSSNHMKVEL